MGLLIVFLTLVLVLDCLFLMLLILVQLPKKEAGAGLAFGGGATDALFGAGTGTALTKLTKYTATIFMVLAIVLSLLMMRHNRARTRGIQEELEKRSGGGLALPMASTSGVPATTLMATNPMFSIQSTNPLVATNAPATNRAPAPAPK